MRGGRSGERLIESSSSWFNSKCPSGQLEVTMQLTSVKRMMGGLGGEMPSTHRQTLNDVETDPHLIGVVCFKCALLNGSCFGKQN